MITLMQRAVVDIAGVKLGQVAGQSALEFREPCPRHACCQQRVSGNIDVTGAVDLT